MNDWYKKTDAQLSAAAHNAATVLNGALLAYGVTAAQANAIETGADTIDASVTDITTKKAGLAAAFDEKAVNRQSTITALNVVAGIIYNNPGVTTAMLLEAGYSPRDTTPTTIIPFPATELLANPFADGSVELKWARNGNPQGVIFNVEVRSEGDTWSQLASTTKAKITVNGFAPGVSKWFRVVATKNDLVALPSNEAPIYFEEELALEIAA